MFRRRKKPIAAEDVVALDTPTRARISPKSPSEALKPSAPPPPPPRIRKPRGGFLSTMSGFLTFALVVAAIGVMGIVFFSRELSTPGPLEADKVVIIPRNTGTPEIASLLQSEGVIDKPVLFELTAYLNRQKGGLKAGEFLFKARTTIDEAVNTLVQGKPILHGITIPEGLTSEQVVQRLADNDVLTGEITDPPREGTLLPDTYKIERGTTRQQLINLMRTAQRNTLQQVWSHRSPDVPIKTPQELVILASIVEKETGRADERTRVAGVFINRLNRRMKLQSDPTIVYGIVGGKGTLGRSILRSEIDRATPYNTYVIEGLPPGPIANPGKATLEAVANPARTKEIFFVADGTGGHAFAETLDQHQRNVQRWRQIERARETENPAAKPIDQVDPVTPDVRGDIGTPDGDLPTRAAAYSDPAPSPASLNVSPSGGQAGRAFDAVQGTKLDPLLNRTYDLTSPKDLPDIGPLPGDAVRQATSGSRHPSGKAEGAKPRKATHRRHAPSQREANRPQPQAATP